MRAYISNPPVGFGAINRPPTVLLNASHSVSFGQQSSEATQRHSCSFPLAAPIRTTNKVKAETAKTSMLYIFASSECYFFRVIRSICGLQVLTRLGT